MSDWVAISGRCQARAEGTTALVKVDGRPDAFALTRDELEAILALLDPDPLDVPADDPDDGSSLRA